MRFGHDLAVALAKAHEGVGKLHQFSGQFERVCQDADKPPTTMGSRTHHLQIGQQRFRNL